ncbi:MAG: hypothetical protein Q8R96_07895 [Bacteroidota bacterium]|nr:hypothetical protein [Bacteroidota bacterium]
MSTIKQQTDEAGISHPGFFMFAFSGKSVVLKNSLQSIAKFVLNLYD